MEEIAEALAFDVSSICRIANTYQCREGFDLVPAIDSRREAKWRGLQQGVYEWLQSKVLTLQE